MQNESTAVKQRDPLFKIANFLFDFFETFFWALFLVIVVFTLFVRICKVDGDSMNDTLLDGQGLLLTDLYSAPKQDDIVVFHLTKSGTEKEYIKRVIATGGQTIHIDFNTKEILVGGVKYEDTHATFKGKNAYLLFPTHDYDAETNTLTAVVPRGYLFVMGDNRNNSSDSRMDMIGFVDERCVLGTVALRFSPFTIFN